MKKTKKRLVGVTVVSADCCTDCVLDHMSVAARTRKEHETLARFKQADDNFRTVKLRAYNNLLSVRDDLEILFSGKNLSDADTLANELSILFYGLPDDFCLPF